MNSMEDVAYASMIRKKPIKTPTPYECLNEINNHCKMLALAEFHMGVQTGYDSLVLIKAALKSHNKKQLKKLIESQLKRLSKDYYYEPHV